MAHDALALVDALGLRTLDVLGFSIGGFVAQEVTLTRPQLVRRLVLAGTGPQGGERMHGWSSEVFEMAMADGQAPSERLLVQAVARADRQRGSSQYRPEPGCG
jgi:pimeloyl-ACP methyl ester carboxylesterase